MNTEYLLKTKKQKKMTLQQIAEVSGIPKRTVDDIFSGKTLNPRIDTLQAIEKALGIENTPDEWMEKEKKMGIQPKYLNSDEEEWLNIRNEILRIHGEQYLETTITMLKALIKE